MGTEKPTSLGNFLHIFHIYNITTIALCVVICIPLSMYSLHKLWRVKNNLIFQKRQSSITIYFVIISIINFIVTAAIFIPRIIWTTAYGPSFVTHLFIQYAASFPLIIYILLCRVYIYYFDINLSKSIINNEWKSLINSSVSNHNNWFVKHKNTFGNAKYWRKYIIFVYILSVIIFYAYVFTSISRSCTEGLRDINHCLSDSTDAHQRFVSYLWNSINIGAILISSPAIILLAIIRYKTPKFQDNFSVRTEINYILLCAAISIPLNIPLFITEEFLYNFWWKHLIETVSINIYMLALLCLVLIHTLWPIRRNKHWLSLFHPNQSVSQPMPPMSPIDVFAKHKDIVRTSTIGLTKLKDEKSTQFRHVDSVASVTSVSNGDEPLSYMDLMSMALRTEEGFGSFMFHLSTEFSVELLISLIDFIQYKQYIARVGEQLVSTQSELNEEIFGILYEQNMLVENGVVPRSELVVQNTFESGVFRASYEEMFNGYAKEMNIEENEACMKAFKLLFECMVAAWYVFDKYIDDGSICEININYSTRTSFTNMFLSRDYESDDQLMQFIKRHITKQLLYHKKKEDKENENQMESVLQNEINSFYFLFDDVSEEMMKLLNYSFRRFTETSLYRKLVTS